MQADLHTHDEIDTAANSGFHTSAIVQSPVAEPRTQQYQNPDFIMAASIASILSIRGFLDWLRTKKEKPNFLQDYDLWNIKVVEVRGKQGRLEHMNKASPEVRRYLKEDNNTKIYSIKIGNAAPIGAFALTRSDEDHLSPLEKTHYDHHKRINHLKEMGFDLSNDNTLQITPLWFEGKEDSKNPPEHILALAILKKLAQECVAHKSNQVLAMITPEQEQMVTELLGIKTLDIPEVKKVHNDKGTLIHVNVSDIYRELNTDLKFFLTGNHNCRG